MVGLIVGIEKANAQMPENVYRVLFFRCSNNPYDRQWQFTKHRLTEKQLADMIKSKTARILNATVVKDRIKGTTGSLTRFGPNTLVVISQIVLEGHGVIGYKVVDFNGNIKNVKLKDLLAYCNEVVKKGGIPLQNAVYVPATENTRDHIRSFENGDFIVELIKMRKVNVPNVGKVEEKAAGKEGEVKEAGKKEDGLNRKDKVKMLEEMYTKEQLKELQLGKEHGVNIKVYSNPRFTPEQMRILREALEEGLPAKIIANPDYDSLAMRYLRADMRNGIDVRNYASPVFDAYQLHQLSLGYTAGVDITKYANPALSAMEMADIREHLESGIWKEFEVTADGSWIA